MKHDPWESLGEPREDSRNKANCQGRGCADSQLSDGRIRQVLDLLHPAPQIIKHGGAASEECTTVSRGLDSHRGPIQETDTERMFELRNCLRNDWLRDREPFGGSRHASGLRDG